MTTLTIEEINQKRLLLSQITLAGEDAVNAASDKLNYAIAKLKKRFDQATKPLTDNFTKAVVGPYNEQLDDLRIKYASVYPVDFDVKEKRGQLLVGENGQYVFTQENTLLFNADARMLASALKDATESFSATQVELPGEPYLASDSWPRMDTISLFIKEELAGLLFTAEVQVSPSIEFKADTWNNNKWPGADNVAVVYTGDIALENGGEAPNVDENNEAGKSEEINDGNAEKPTINS